MGCKFALDDFEVGFLTFTHLQRLPVDYLKIDGAFIRDLDTNPTNKALVQAINSVAHALGIATIAEYVENAAIWEILRELEIDCGQGYYLGKPSPLAEQEVEARVKQGDGSPASLLESIGGVIAEQTAASAEEVAAASQEQAATMVSVSQSAEALAKLGESLMGEVARFKV